MMIWNPNELLDDFDKVARLAHVPIAPTAVHTETLHMPHAAPRLPSGKMAVYVFSDRDRVLKVGKAGPNTKSRYETQHYTGSAPSTLHGFLLKDPAMVTQHGLTKETAAAWIKQNTDRVNFTLDADAGPLVLALLETFVQCRLQPIYEGRLTH